MKKPCRRCLLGEFDRDKFMEILKQRIDSIPDDNRVDAECYEFRLGICQRCDELTDGLCGECGCFVELRAAKRNMDCPVDRWRKL